MLFDRSIARPVVQQRAVDGDPGRGSSTGASTARQRSRANTKNPLRFAETVSPHHLEKCPEACYRSEDSVHSATRRRTEF